MPPVIPSQRERLETIKEAESADAPSAFSVPQDPEGPTPMPTSMSFREDYDAIKLARPGDIALYQLGDFYEMFGPDARVASRELDLMLTQRNLLDVGRVAMCGIPGHKLDEYVRNLRDRHDVTVSSIGLDGKRLTISYLSMEHEARNAREAEAPVPEESAPVHVPTPAPTPARETTHGEIDAALQAWNGDADSKRAVASYMKDHAREKDTAAWLRAEYGSDLPAFPVKIPDTGQYQHLPWPKVQRRIAQLVQRDMFLSYAERAHIPEQEPAPTLQEIYEQYKPILKEFVLSDGPYQNACQNSDRDTAVIEGHAAVTRAAQEIQDPDFMRLYFDMSGFRKRLHREIIDETYPVLSQPQREQAEVPDLSDQPVTREGDTITIGNGEATHEVEITVSDEEWQTIQEFTGAADLPPHDPLAPAYRPGDMVYLNNTAF